MLPDVSLVIATYNRGPRIGRTLDSALSQSHPFAEIIVVDDCSTDGTGEWVAQHYPGVSVVRTPHNLFSSGARNHGSRSARAELLAFLDHDDILLPIANETLCRTLTTFSSAQAAFADHTYENVTAGLSYPDHHHSQAAFARLASVRTLSSAVSSRLYGRSLYLALLRGNLLQQPYLIRKSAFQYVGGYQEDVRYCEDWDLYCRLLRNGPVAMTDQVISRHIIEGENLHLAHGQEVMHMRVLERLARKAYLDPRAHLACRRRLAVYEKSLGDSLAEGNDLRGALRRYLRSASWWPMDHVVVARCLGWSCSIAGQFLGGRR